MKPAVAAATGTSIGIVTDGDLSRHIFRNLLLEAGCSAQFFTAAQLAQAAPAVVAVPVAWLLDTAHTDMDAALDRIEQYPHAPCLISDEAPPPQASPAFAGWRRRMLDKLEELVAAAEAPARAARPAPAAVWVLAASTGGPQAVDRFLAALPAGLPIALVYAQHIDDSFDRVLADALTRHGDRYAVSLGRGEQQLAPGSLLLVPADRQLRFLPFHRAVATRQRWDGPYQPAIDQVVAQLARLYQQRCGVIVFSGLCDDGALGCRVVRGCGGEVWVQSPDSCVSPDMPNAALATGSVRRQGTPEQLAQALASRYAA